MKEKLKLFDRTDLLDDRFFEMQSDSIMKNVRTLEVSRPKQKFAQLRFLDSKSGGVARGPVESSLGNAMGIMLFKVRK